jgi:hypothetical protein
MQSQRIQDREISVAASDDQRDKAVLMLLSGGAGYPWTVQEIAREMQAPLEAEDAIRRLTETGLVHRFEDFVFPTRTARRAGELEVGTV